MGSVVVVDVGIVAAMDGLRQDACENRVIRSTHEFHRGSAAVLMSVLVVAVVVVVVVVVLVVAAVECLVAFVGGSFCSTVAKSKATRHFGS